MLGALAKLTDVITLDALNNAIEEEFSDYSEKIIKSNKAAVQKCYEMIE
jgi:Pyruvate/2-oxoacid:ferredoxin oxidoreductase gamma subunit